MLAATSPIVLVAMLAIRATSPGPAIFLQTRVGREGALFSCR
ncbi:sugar transferase, partial [bacterium M00.F.Ca.ET.141.01.1.1]